MNQEAIPLPPMSEALVPAAHGTKGVYYDRDTCLRALRQARRNHQQRIARERKRRERMLRRQRLREQAARRAA